jgi:WD40 repeat protein
MKLWDTGHTKEIIATRTLHTQDIMALAFSHDGMQLASASEDGTVRLWDGGDGASNGILDHSFYNVPTSIAFSSRLLAVATYHSIVLFDRKSLEFVYAFPQGCNICLSFSSDDSRLASAYNYGSSAYVQVWDVEKYARITGFNIESTIERLELSPYGNRLAVTRHGDGNFEFFDVVNGESINSMRRAEISWFSPNRVWVSRSYDRDYGYCVRERFCAQDDGVPILWVPKGITDGGIFMVGSSMFAQGTGDGGIVVGQIPTT